jgi:hypothetical protein
VFREHWYKPSFWRWWWSTRADTGAKVVVATALFAVVLAGGWFAADSLTAASASGASTEAYVFESTLVKTVTVREKGRLVRKVVPVVRRVVLRPRTAYATLTDVATNVVTAPGATRVVKQTVARYVPSVQTRILTTGGKVRTVSETRRVPTVQTRTQTNVVTAERTVTDAQVRTALVTNERTVVNQQTVTATRTQTQPVTVVETKPVTVTETETAPAVTVTTVETLPPDTTTVFVTVTIKHR